MFTDYWLLATLIEGSQSKISWHLPLDIAYRLQKDTAGARFFLPYLSFTRQNSPQARKSVCSAFVSLTNF